MNQFEAIYIKGRPIQVSILDKHISYRDKGVFFAHKENKKVTMMVIAETYEEAEKFAMSYIIKKGYDQ